MEFNLQNPFNQQNMMYGYEIQQQRPQMYQQPSQLDFNTMSMMHNMNQPHTLDHMNQLNDPNYALRSSIPSLDLDFNNVPTLYSNTPFMSQMASPPSPESDQYLSFDSSPLTSNGSPQISAPEVKTNPNVQIDVILMHKPRGSQGIWQPVTPGAGLRVTKGKGKRLKLQIKSNVEFDKNRLEIQMFDLMTSISSTEGFTLENTFDLDSPHLVELELKITRYCKRCQFVVTVHTLHHGPKTLKTIEFCSHNNGKQTKTEATTTTTTTSPKEGETLLSGNIAEKKRKHEVTGEDETITVVNGPLEVNGSVRAHSFLQFSDVRLKTNISDIADAADMITQLQGKTYQWKRDMLATATGGKRVIGLIAQEVQKILPEVVHEDPNTGILSVSYAEIVPVIIEAFKEHVGKFQLESKEVRGELEDLKQKIARIEQMSVHNARVYQYLQPNYVMYAPPSPLLPSHSGSSVPSLISNPSSTALLINSPHYAPTYLPVKSHEISKKNLKTSEQYSQEMNTKFASFLRVFMFVFGIFSVVGAVILLFKFERHSPTGAVACLFVLGAVLVIVAVVSHCIVAFRWRTKGEPDYAVPPYQL